MLLHDVRDDHDDDHHDPYAAFPGIAVRADPTGLAVDRTTGALLVADGTTGAILRIDEGVAQRRITTIAHLAQSRAVHTSASRALAPSRAIAPLVGGIAITPFGTVFATHAGGISDGSIARIDPDGHVETIDRLARDAWRLGVTYDVREHALYATQFYTSRFGAHDGSIIAIDLVSGEPSTILDGFGKPIGIAKLGDTLVVADARQRAVYRVDLRAGRAIHRLQLVGDLGRPDSVCACTADSVLVSSFDPELGRGAVRRLWLDGRTRGIGSGPWDPSGVATDGERVFVGVRRSNKVLVFPLG
jgi:DNA-binding beta-propeller fold protein YncE